MCTNMENKLIGSAEVVFFVSGGKWNAELHNQLAANIFYLVIFNQ